MPTPTMQYLHAHRLACLLLVIAVFGISLWLLAADVARGFAITRTTTFNQLQQQYGQLVAPDSGISGMMGVTTLRPAMHVTVAGIGLAVFTLTLVIFLRPRHGWMDRALMKGKPPQLAIAAAAIVAGLVTVGYLATTLELLGQWSQLGGKGYSLLHSTLGKYLADGGVWLNPAAPIAFSTWCIAAVVWFFILRKPASNHDWFIRMIIITYGLFVASGLLTLIAGSIQTYHLGFDYGYVNSGAYTGAGIGFTVMLWTAVPSLVLVWTGETYRRITEGLCVNCGYNLQGATGSTCPECGAMIDPRVQMSIKTQTPTA